MKTLEINQLRLHFLLLTVLFSTSEKNNLFPVVFHWEKKAAQNMFSLIYCPLVTYTNWKPSITQEVQNKNILSQL